MFVEVLRALEYAHAGGVIHRDLRPMNILVRTSDRQPIILDFGAACVLDEMDTTGLTTHAVGTLGYIPSEVLADPGLKTPLHDVHTCGVMLYEVLAGQRPDPANYSPLTLVDEAFDFLDDIVARAIAGVDQRTGSAAEFANQLESLRTES